MSDRDVLDATAARLVADLMPIAIVVAGEGADALARALEGAGAGADVIAPDSAGPYDLALLLADPAQFATATIQKLADLSDRIVFIPTPSASGAHLDALTAWFEHFADIGYQPVVEYDAGYLGEGAFLVDRNATAAETDLAGFAERLSLGGALHASTMRIAELEAGVADAAALRTALAAAHADITALRAALASADARAAALAEEATVWAPLRDWIRAAVADPSRQQDQPPALPKRRFSLARLFGQGVAPAPADARLAAVARIRATKLFDAAWYIACHPELAETGEDPVRHYVLRGAAQGFDPGPWFDTAAYVRRHPGLEPALTNPLLHAIDSGEEAVLLARAAKSF